MIIAFNSRYVRPPLRLRKFLCLILKSIREVGDYETGNEKLGAVFVIGYLSLLNSGLVCSGGPQIIFIYNFFFFGRCEGNFIRRKESCRSWKLLGVYDPGPYFILFLLIRTKEGALLK